MKTYMILAVAFLTFSLNQVQAQDSTKINSETFQAFRNLFQDARHVRWTSLSKGISQAQFVQSGKSWVAYFDHGGNLITSGRKVSSPSDLPVTVEAGLRTAKSRLEKKSGTLDIGLIYEMNFGGDTRYVVTMQNKNQISTVSISGSGYTTFEKNKKVRPAEAPIREN